MYEAALEAMQATAAGVAAGQTLGSLHAKMHAALAKHGLAAHLGPSAGYVTGAVVFHETLDATADNTATLAPGEGVVVRLALAGVDDLAGGSFGLVLADTYVVGRSGAVTAPITALAGDVTYMVAEGDGGSGVTDIADDAPGSTTRQSRRQLEKRAEMGVAESSQSMKESQTKLEAELNDRARKRLLGAAGPEAPAAGANGVPEKGPKQLSYTSNAAVRLAFGDAGLGRLDKVVLHAKAETLLVPLNGVMVPFHVATIKQLTCIDEGTHALLRVSFHTPQAVRGPTAAKAKALTFYSDPSQVYVKELLFSTPDRPHFMCVLCFLPFLLLLTHWTQARGEGVQGAPQARRRADRRGPRPCGGGKDGGK